MKVERFSLAGGGIVLLIAAVATAVPSLTPGVVAETEMAVAGATVHVVSDEFRFEAVRKGRAIEWARRTPDPDREFVLYLDEDSRVESFDGLPDADVVQLRERPRRTGPHSRTSRTSTGWASKS